MSSGLCVCGDCSLTMDMSLKETNPVKPVKGKKEPALGNPIKPFITECGPEPSRRYEGTEQQSWVTEESCGITRVHDQSLSPMEHHQHILLVECMFVAGSKTFLKHYVTCGAIRSPVPETSRH